jgi:hypothetical protein
MRDLKRRLMLESRPAHTLVTRLSDDQDYRKKREYVKGTRDGRREMPRNELSGFEVLARPYMIDRGG